MNYYCIIRSDKKYKMKSKITLKNGYHFNQKLKITLFNYEMINYIFNKKVTISLKEIINIFLLYEDDEDGREGILVPKIETLRKTLLGKYAKFLSEGEIESYLTKCDKIECKVVSRKNKKSKNL